MDLIASRQLAIFARSKGLRLQGILYYPKANIAELLCGILQGRGVDIRTAKQQVKHVLAGVSWLLLLETIYIFLIENTYAGNNSYLNDPRMSKAYSEYYTYVFSYIYIYLCSYV